jgi:hypothetical protein
MLEWSTWRSTLHHNQSIAVKRRPHVFSHYKNKARDIIRLPVDFATILEYKSDRTCIYDYEIQTEL